MFHRQELPSVVPREQRLVHDVPSLEFAKSSGRTTWHALGLDAHAHRAQRISRKALQCKSGSNEYHQNSWVIPVQSASHCIVTHHDPSHICLYAGPVHEEKDSQELLCLLVHAQECSNSGGIRSDSLTKVFCRGSDKPSLPPYDGVLVILHNTAAIEPVRPCRRSTIVWPVVGECQDHSHTMGSRFRNHVIQALRDQ